MARLQYDGCSQHQTGTIPLRKDIRRELPGLNKDQAGSVPAVHVDLRPHNQMVSGS